MAIRAEAPRIIVAGTASGSGKTTFTCGLLQVLKDAGLSVAAGKVGPDFIDPTFHERVLGVPSRNLDLFLGNADLVCELLAEGAKGADVTVIEGVMGYYDGIALGTDASSYDVACVTKSPVILVVDARARSLSVAAEVAGFARFRSPSQVVGVVLNRVSAARYPLLKEAVERETGLPVFGFMPPIEEASLPSRHLGLVRAEEIADFRTRIDALAETLRTTLDVEAILAHARGAQPLVYRPRELPESVPDKPVIAVAHDDAFSFYYRDSLDLLERLGAHVVLFSPLRDQELPTGTCGLYLGGGYPELHARELGANVALRTQLRVAIASGMPTIAECGGFLYLHETLEDTQGQDWPMVGAVTGRAFRTERLGRFGYVTLEACGESLLAHKGERLAAHEFHYWESEHPGNAFHARKPQSERSWDCVQASGTLYAGFPHLYLCGSPVAAKRFVDACVAYGLGASADMGEGAW